MTTEIFIVNTYTWLTDQMFKELLLIFVSTIFKTHPALCIFRIVNYVTLKLFQIYF